MEEVTACFRRLENGDMAVVDWPDITLPVKGFSPKKGKAYTYNKVRHPELARYEYEGREYVVCDAVPLERVCETGIMADAFAKLGL